MAGSVTTVLDSAATELPSQTISDTSVTVDDVKPSKMKEFYDSILKETKTRALTIMLLTLSEPLSGTSRIPFIVFYIQSFDPSVSTAQISVLLFAASIWSSITETGLTACGDRFGHDNIYTLCKVVALIGLSVEAISPSFAVFIIGNMISKVPNRPITFAYLASVLPHKLAVKYCGLLYSLLSIFYLLGPIIGALIAQFINYRAIFIFNAIFHVVLLFVCYISLNGSIKYLEHKQTLVGIIDGLDEDEQFPICLRHAKSAKKSEVKTDKTSNILSEYIKFWRSLPVYDLVMLLCSIIINDLAWSCEAIIIYYFVLFLSNVYNASSLYGSFMLLQITLIIGVTTLALPRIVKRIIPSYIWLLSVFGVVQAGVCVLIIGLDHPLEMHWAYNIGFAFAFGMICMVSEMCILELQPKEHSGKVSGVKAGLRNICRAVALVIVGLFWKEPYNAIWISGIVIAMIVCMLSVVMMLMVKCKKETKQPTNDGDDVPKCKQWNSAAPDKCKDAVENNGRDFEVIDIKAVGGDAVEAKATNKDAMEVKAVSIVVVDE